MLKSFFAILLVFFSVFSFATAWQVPSVPQGEDDPNVFVPLNTGSVAQTKTGNLTLSNWLALGSGSTAGLQAGDLSAGGAGLFNGFGLLSGGFQLGITKVAGVNGGTPAAGSVLQSADTLGNAKWVATSTLGLSGSGGSGSSDYWTRAGGNIYPTTTTDNVGIGGTPASGARFSVKQSAKEFNFTGSGASGYAANFTLDDTGLKIGNNGSAKDLRLQTGNSSSVATDRVTIKTDAFGTGAVGIGTTNPVAELQVMAGTNPGFTPAAGDWAILASGASNQNRIGTVDSSSGTYIQTIGGSRGEISTWQWPSGPGMPLYLNANGGNVVTSGYLLVQAAEPNGKFAVDNTSNSGTEFAVDASAGADTVLIRQPGTLNSAANAVDIVGNNHSTPAWAAGAALNVVQQGAAGLAIEATGRSIFHGNIVGDGLSISGTKNFQIKHPLKPGKDLVHASLEGPEAGVYYRGTAELKNGQVTISLPDYFEALTSKQDRTVQLTNLDGGDVIFVKSQNGAQVKNGKFIVQSSNKNSQQKFNWEVKAIRDDIPALEVEPESLEN
ncbi:MAG: hypothetical protein AAB364_02725 [Patescibacteria group bacterium]